MIIVLQKLNSHVPATTSLNIKTVAVYEKIFGGTKNI